MNMKSEDKNLVEIQAQWVTVRGRIRQKIGDAQFKSWIKVLVFEDYDDHKVILSVSSNFVRTRIIEQYLDIIKSYWLVENLKINDILINSMGQGTLGRVSKNNSISEKYIIHNCITFLRAKDIYSQVYLYQFISSKENYFISVSQGSTGQTTLKKSLIEDLDIIIPESNLLKKYDSIVIPMWNKIGVLKNQNKKLKSARDILLPRLMNQTIEV